MLASGPDLQLGWGERTNGGGARVSIPCEACGTMNVYGNRTCGSCGAALSRPVVLSGADPVCAVHPGIRAVGASSRCGAFTCPDCLSPGGRAQVGQVICCLCSARDPSTLVPWDRRGEL